MSDALPKSAARKIKIGSFTQISEKNVACCIPMYHR
jgi:hypothetical protein